MTKSYVEEFTEIKAFILEHAPAGEMPANMQRALESCDKLSYLYNDLANGNKILQNSLFNHVSVQLLAALTSKITGTTVTTNIVNAAFDGTELYFKEFKKRYKEGLPT